MIMKLTTVKRDDLVYFTAPGIETKHCFTTRLGGVSSGHLAAMNIGTHRGDDPRKVQKNYGILADDLGFDPEKLVLTTQKHTDTVLRVGAAHWGAGLTAPELPDCDALVTDTPGTALVIFTADCTPVLLYDPVTGAVGAAHAGWRGTARRIAEKTVQTMVSAFGCKPENIRAAIGPNIAQCCFETDADVPQALAESYGEDVWAYIQKRNDKYYVNLKAVNALSLRRAGVRHIEVSDRCTACETELFWSHRRTGGVRGSQGAIIVCKEEPR